MSEAVLFPYAPKTGSFARSKNDGLSSLELVALYDIVTFGTVGVVVGRCRPSSVLMLLDDTVTFGIVDVATVTFGMLIVVAGRRLSSLEYSIDLVPALVIFCSSVDSPSSYLCGKNESSATGYRDNITQMFDCQEVFCGNVSIA